jgi:hypothetical protein
MDAFSKFQMKVEKPIKVQEPTASKNTLCTEIGCYANCQESCRLPFALTSKWIKLCGVMSDGVCKVCNHSFQSHRHFRAKWVDKVDTPVSIDPKKKKDWEDAEDSKEKKAVLLESYQQALSGYNQYINDGTLELAQLVDDYAGLSLSGSFSAQVEKAVRLLEQKYAAMQEQGADQDQIRRIEGSLDVMRRKLELLRKAKAPDGSAWAPAIGRKVKDLVGCHVDTL